MILFSPLLFRVSGEVGLPSVKSSQLDAGLKGRVLIEELNCAACHSTTAPLAARSKKATRLADIGSRVNPAYLEAFIRDPHGTKPGTTMPDVLGYLEDGGRRDAADCLTHFLLSLKPQDFHHQPADSVAARQGERLFHARGCAACHSPRNSRGTELLPATSVPLGDLNKKYSQSSLIDFLRNPHASRPSGRMPNLNLPDSEIRNIAHYLLQDIRVQGPLAYTLYRGQVWEGLKSDEVHAERAGLVKDFSLESLGGVQHHTAVEYTGWLNIATSGNYRFIFEANGGSLTMDGNKLLDQEPSDRRGIKAMEAAIHLTTGWHQIQLTYFHTGYDPSLNFQMEGPDFLRQPIPSSMLSLSNEPIPVLQALQVDPGLAARGHELFGKLGCARCHDDLNISSPAATEWAHLNPTRGCLSGTVGAWPLFDLSAEQRAWIAEALPQIEGHELNDLERLNTTLVTFNCLACHRREGLGGIAPERSVYFTGTHEALGDQGRIPPPLTHVGAKLQAAWTAEVLLHGKRQRNYLNTAMPQYGEANVGHLVDLFGRIDHLEIVEIPEVQDLAAFKSAGREMMGTQGFSCIACHNFNGQAATGAGALDIVYTTERLQKNWFHLYLREPARFHPTVIMPAFWPGGVSVRPNLLGGDPARQIEALWCYLEDGIHAKSPLGLSRQSSELRVTDVTEVCRGQGPVGYRGIAVGYPSGVSLAFDSEQMSLRMLWKGEFVNVDSGRFDPRGHDRISFPSGIPFHRLKSLDENWPHKGKTSYAFPQDHGYQFRGYHLNAERRPTFLYQYSDIAVEDYFEDVRDSQGGTGFKRTLRFDTPEAHPPFYFRAAAGQKVTRLADDNYQIDRVHLRLVGTQTPIIREGNPAELLIPIGLPKGRSTLSLELQW